MKDWTQRTNSQLNFIKNFPISENGKRLQFELEKIGIKKTQYECRERYINKLDPSVNQESWDIKQIKQIFKYYDQYGSQWSQIQKFLPGRTQNSIKNKFYGTIRNLIRAIFKNLKKQNRPNLQNFTTNKLIDFYEGKKDFKKLKSFAKDLLASIDYNIKKGFDVTKVPEYTYFIDELLQIMPPETKKISQTQKSEI